MTPDVFTQQLNTQFLEAKLAAEGAGPAPIEAFCANIPSTGQKEPFVFGSAVGSMKKFTGHRTFTKFAADTYEIVNEPYYNGFEVNKDDVDDDKVGMYKIYPAGVVKRANMKKQELALEALRDGETGLGFDKTAFFATSHNVATVKASGVGSGEGGANIMTFTGTGNSDGLVYKIVLVVNDGSTIIKPVIITERTPLTALQTDAGTPQAEKDKKYQYWLDARYGKGYGFWWDACLIKITNLPTQTELQTILGKAKVRMMSFLLPKDSGEDNDIAFHEHLNFNTNTVTALYSVPLDAMMRIVLGNDTIVVSGAAVSNAYKGFAQGIPTQYLTP